MLSVCSDCERLCVHPTLVAVEEKVRTHPEVRPAKEFAAVAQKAQQRITIVTETWQQEMVGQQKSSPAVREVEDDWFILLDVATKKSGIMELITHNFV